MNKKVVASGDLRWTIPALLTLATVAVLLTAAAPASAAAGTTKSSAGPVLAQGAGMGDRPSAAVRALQRRLRKQGYSLGRPGVDGRFGPITDSAVRRLQSDHGLVVDGIAGRKTRGLLRLVERAQRADRAARRRPSSRPLTPSRPSTRPAPPVTVPRTPAPARASDDSGSDVLLRILVGVAAAFAAYCVMLAVGAARRRPRPGEDVDADLAPPPAPTPAPSRVQAVPLPAQPPALPPGVVPIPLREGPGGRPTHLAPGAPVIGYVTLSEEEEHEGAEGPAETIADACTRADWQLFDVVTDRERGRGLERPGLNYALRQIAERRARGLVVSEVRRLTHSVMELGALLEWFRDAGAVLVALDLAIDTSTPGGQEIAGTLITLGDWQRNHHAERTRHGLAEVRASGGHPGRPAVSDRPDLAGRITRMRTSGMTLQAIADQLNAEGVPTIRGGTMWRPSSVQAALGYRRPGQRGPRDQLPSLEEDRLP